MDHVWWCDTIHDVEVSRSTAKVGFLPHVEVQGDGRGGVVNCRSTGRARSDLKQEECAMDLIVGPVDWQS